MATQKRTYESLKSHLFKAFYQYDFYQAVDLVESFYPNRQQLSNTLLSKASDEPLEPAKETVRFIVKPDFSFQTSQIKDLYQKDDEPAVMQVPFLGLIGPSGVLPDWYHQLAYRLDFAHTAAGHDYPSAMTAFFNLFHHRLITLFYLGWKKHQLCKQYLPDGSDEYSKFFLFLSGFSPKALKDQNIPFNPLIFLSGLISGHSSSANTLKTVLSYITRIKVHIEQFIPRFFTIHLDDQTKIGHSYNTLGHSAFCGSQAWENQTKFRVMFKPDNFHTLKKLLPLNKNGLLQLIFSMIRLLVEPSYEFDIQIDILIEKLPICYLGTPKSVELSNEKETQSYLGWNSVLGDHKTSTKIHSVIFSNPC